MTELSPEEWGNRYRNIRGTCEALLIMADKRVGKDIYGKVYSGDWAAFAAKTEAWHSRKQRRRRA
jgi:hypothetical protein